MIKFKIISVGKAQKGWLEQALKEYEKRLTQKAKISYLWVDNDQALLKKVACESSIICLDPNGKLHSSESLADYLQQEWEKNGATVTIVIGGANGLPAPLKAQKLISLSPLTFTHQITRLVLIEQIYRAFAIIGGTSYHK